ncbi:glutathione S-transferase 3, mitochondrial-like isoform X2 [Haemaphysalis longicornis]
MRTFSLTVSDEYGYVVLVAAASAVVNRWLALRVVGARKRFGVKLPTMYSNSNVVFNCIQRSHQHFLEYYPQFLMMLFLVGLEFPKLAAGAGLVYLAGRVVYSIGYSTGDPNKRTRGAFMYCGLVTLFLLTIYLGLRMLGWF